jgi:hypothetical protein
MPDATIHRTLDAVSFVEDDQGSIEMELVRASDSTDDVMEIVVASVLASLSIAVAPVAGFLTRVGGWGIALFDPVSLFWVAAFLIGGRKVGFVSMAAGTVGLFLFDPTGIGPFFKLAATAPMIIVPWVLANRSEHDRKGMYLSDTRAYTVSMLGASILRLAIMIPVNLIVVSIMLPFIGISEIITITLTLNAFQSFWDALVPYVIVHKTPVYDKFGMW